MERGNLYSKQGHSRFLASLLSTGVFWKDLSLLIINSVASVF